MSFDEYNLYAQGYFVRVGRVQEGTRRLYQLMWNANCAKSDQIRTYDQLIRQFPLPHDKPGLISIISKEEMIARWKKGKDRESKMKNKQ